MQKVYHSAWHTLSTQPACFLCVMVTPELLSKGQGLRGGGEGMDQQQEGILCNLCFLLNHKIAKGRISTTYLYILHRACPVLIIADSADYRIEYYCVKSGDSNCNSRIANNNCRMTFRNVLLPERHYCFLCGRHSRDIERHRETPSLPLMMETDFI